MSLICVNLIMYGADMLRNGQYVSAEGYFDRALKIEPNNFEALYYNSIAKEKVGKFDESISLGKKALSLDYYQPNAETLFCLYFNIANAAYLLKKFEDSIPYYFEAIKLRPSFPDPYINLGLAFRAIGKFKDALDVCIELQKHCSSINEGPFQESLLHLKMGDFKIGWEKYETRHIIHKVDNSQFNLWNGEKLTGKTIMLLTEQGFGDTLQFVRYAKMVKARGAKTVYLLVRTPLVRLLKSVEGVDQLITFDDLEENIKADALPKVDYHVWLLSLPGIFKTSLKTIPAPIPYFKPLPKELALWKRKLSKYDTLKVGVAWAGGSRITNRDIFECDLARSMFLEQYIPLLKIPNIQFFNLQKDDSKEQIKTLPLDINLIDYMDDIRDFAETAAFVQNLDLVISVDTSIVHLVGGLGKPIWMLSRNNGCWRWLAERDDSPWYPSMKIYHQNQQEDWDETIERVRKDLVIWST